MHFEEGTKLYDTGHYVEAAAEYERAYMLSDETSLLFNMGQAYRLGGDAARALRSYRAYLRRVPNADGRAEVEAKIAELQRAIEQSEMIESNVYKGKDRVDAVQEALHPDIPGGGENKE